MVVDKDTFGSSSVYTHAVMHHALTHARTHIQAHTRTHARTRTRTRTHTKSILLTRSEERISQPCMHVLRNFRVHSRSGVWQLSRQNDRPQFTYPLGMSSLFSHRHLLHYRPSKRTKHTATVSSVLLKHNSAYMSMFV